MGDSNTDNAPNPDDAEPQARAQASAGDAPAEETGGRGAEASAPEAADVGAPPPEPAETEAPAPEPAETEAPAAESAETEAPAPESAETEAPAPGVAAEAEEAVPAGT